MVYFYEDFAKAVVNQRPHRRVCLSFIKECVNIRVLGMKYLDHFRNSKIGLLWVLDDSYIDIYMLKLILVNTKY